MFFAKPRGGDVAAHHDRMSRRAILFNLAGCGVWMAAWLDGVTLMMMAALLWPLTAAVVIGLLFVHLSGIVYAGQLALGQRMYGRAATLFVAAAAPLAVLAVNVLRGMG